MTGNASEADDLVQETFVRALEKPPRRMDEPLRPWLVRVAVNLSRDYLRRRRRSYEGTWLPSPLPTDNPDSPSSFEPPAGDQDSPMARYDMMESVSFAFLLALEALTPSQRAVLLLRDVLDYSTAETSDALGITEVTVKVTLHRARRAMREYDKNRTRPEPERRQMTRRALEQFLLYLSSHNVEGLERLLAHDVISMSDGGGEVAAALKPIHGLNKVVRLVTKLAERDYGPAQIFFRFFNGFPSIVFERSSPPDGHASRFTVHCDVDTAGKINRLYTVLAPKKLSAI
jgi:RNA polymerase sigma-70 factor (ECF subfamily)